MAQKKKVLAKPAAKSVGAGKARTAAASGAKPKAKARAASPVPARKPSKPIAAKVKAAAKAVTPAKKPVQPKKVTVVAKPVEKAAVARPVKTAVPAVAVKPAPVASKPIVAPAAPAVAAARPAAAAAPAAKTAVAPGLTKASLAGLIRTPSAGVPGQVARTVSSAVPKQAIKTFTAPMMPRDLAAKAVEARQQQVAAANKKPVSTRHGFKTNEFIVYPAHGVGRIVGIEEQEIAGMSLELFVIQFEKDKMTLRVPTGKLQSVGMRKLADEVIVKRAMETLKGRARIKRTMWSRRAQEYEAKINSGDLISIAEVVRDLYRSETQPEQSYSERQLYEAALDRMAREIAAVDRLDERGAVQRITEVLSKSAKGRRLAAESAQAAEGADVKAA